ncbi:MAG: oligosaccharide flippase family protein [Candidatus Diapherotrites archaeon]|uniref:Oligosaccharide flippase family protein n=1 Tax=Candidatus Iainarchaeum sp. TaxID=3101447 RepID=A0A939C480_9ARCH|nr:oligosaccharide flippase family protein [Candidatus Diapherotrites archaeon]
MALLLAQVIFGLSSYAVNFFLARSLGPVDYGSYGIVISMLMLLNIIFLSGLHAAVSRFVSAAPENAEAIKKAALKLGLLLGIGIAFLYFLSAPLIALLLNDLSLTPLIQLSALAIPGFALYPVFIGFFNGLRKYRKQALVSVSYSIAKAVLVISLVLFGFSLFGAIAGFALAAFAALFFGLASSFPKRSESFSSIALFKFALPVTVSRVLFEFSASAGLFSVKSLLLASELPGFYNAAFQLSRLPLFFSYAFVSALFPIISGSFSNEPREKTRRKLLSALKYFLAAILLIAFLLYIFSEQVIVFFFSSSYLPAVLPLSILALSGIFTALFFFLTAVLFAIGKPSRAMLLSLAVFIASIALNLALVPVHGMAGAAFAIFGAFLLGCALSALVVWRSLRG